MMSFDKTEKNGPTSVAKNVVTLTDNFQHIFQISNISPQMNDVLRLWQYLVIL